MEIQYTIDDLTTGGPDARWFNVSCLMLDEDDRVLGELPIAVVFRKEMVQWLVDEWVKRELVPCFDVHRYLFVIGEAGKNPD